MKFNRRLLILATTGMLASGVQAQTTQGVSDNEIVIGTHNEFDLAPVDPTGGVEFVNAQLHAVSQHGHAGGGWA